MDESAVVRVVGRMVGSFSVNSSTVLPNASTLVPIASAEFLGEDSDALIIVGLAAGKSHQEIAEKAQLHHVTVSRKSRDPAIRAKVEAVRRDMVDRAIAHLADAAVDAVVLLHNKIRSTDESSRDQIQAAKAILHTLAVGANCPECARRAAAERSKPLVSLEEMQANDRRIEEEYALLQQRRNEARLQNAAEEARVLAGQELPKVISYED